MLPSVHYNISHIITACMLCGWFDPKCCALCPSAPPPSPTPPLCHNTITLTCVCVNLVHTKIVPTCNHPLPTTRTSHPLNAKRINPTKWRCDPSEPPRPPHSNSINARVRRTDKVVVNKVPRSLRPEQTNAQRTHTHLSASPPPKKTQCHSCPCLQIVHK